MESTSWTEEEWRSLLEAIKYKQCTPFLGSGACAGTLPTGRSIAQEWADEYDYPFPDKEDLPSVAQFIAIRTGALGSLTPKLKIRERFSGKGPPDFSKAEEPHRLVADLQLPVYITTNYDNFMLTALQRDGRTPTREICDWKPVVGRRVTKSRPTSPPSSDRPLVFHLHGVLETPETMVLTEDDYLEFLTNVSATRGLIPPHIEAALSNSCLLFLGYSLNDMNFKVLFRKLAWYMRRTEGTRHISVQLAPDANATQEEELALLRRQREYLETHYQLQKVKIYWGTCANFAAELANRWKAYRD